MAIILTEGYQGRASNEQWVPPGTYDDDADELHGAGSYLVENGFAEQVGGKAPAKKKGKKNDDELVGMTDQGGPANADTGTPNADPNAAPSS